jgi:hypothetical protein
MLHNTGGGVTKLILAGPGYPCRSTANVGTEAPPPFTSVRTVRARHSVELF